jgi:glycosyltransferase involved in cell wall biosynthesis
MSAKILMVACYAMDKPDAELIHFSSVANSLLLQGHDVSIFHLSLQDAPAIRSLILPGIDFHEHSIKSPLNSIMFIRGGLTVPAFLLHLLRKKPDVIYARLGIVSSLYIIAARILWGKRIKIITEHNGWIGPEAISSGKPRPIAFLGKELQKWSARSSDRVRAVSQGIKSYLFSLGVEEEKIAIIGNGTDINHFRPLDITPIYDVGFIGNFAKWQGLEWLIDAFAQVVEARSGTRLAIGGSGPEESIIREKIERYSLGKQVALVGVVPYQEAPAFINQCRICVAPFRSRGSESDNKSISPLKIRDYAACGKAIISSRIPGLEELEGAGFGVLVPQGDTTGLSTAMIKLLEQSELCNGMGRKARQYAESHYSWDLIAEQISYLIDAITLSRHKNPS